MKNTCAIFAGIVAVAAVLLLPTTASANIFTLVCQPVADPAPPEWFGGPWLQPLTVKVDTNAQSVELLDSNSKALADTVHFGRLAGLAGYQLDVVIDENVIRWGVIRMWGISGYVDRKTGRIDVLWAPDRGYDPNTIRQFHGNCRQQ